MNGCFCGLNLHSYKQIDCCNGFFSSHGAGGQVDLMETSETPETPEYVMLHGIYLPSVVYKFVIIAQ